MKDKKGLVLCVDDEPNILRSLHWLLHKDFDVMTALNGTSGLDMLRKHNFDVIVSDQRMPGMIGSEFLREACKTSPRSMRILLTGYSDMQAILRSVNEGEVFRFVNKPWANDELTKTVEEAAVIAKSNPAPLAAPEQAVGGGSVLVIDDKEDLIQMLKEVAEPDTVFRRASNLAEAVKIVNTQPVGVVVCDTRVSGADATTLIKLLKQQRPEIVSIVLTADTDVDEIVKLINQGQIYRFVPKPAKPGFLKIMLTSAVQKHYELKANPAIAKRHMVEELTADVEQKLMQDIQQQEQSSVPAASRETEVSQEGSLLGRLSSGFRKLFS